VRDQPLGVLGSNPGSIWQAQLVRQWSDDVVYFAHTHEPSAEEEAALVARGIHVCRGEVRRLVVEDDRLTGVELADGQFVARSAVFVRPVNLPRPGDLLAQLGCEVDDSGFAVVDQTGRTSVPGVWAAGNAVDPGAKVITAAGAGASAAIAINADLVRDDITVAMAARSASA
jgi:thioredoxin reductase